MNSPPAGFEGDRRAAPVALSLRALGLGDFLTALPALRAIRRAFPGHHHVLAAPGALLPLAARSGAVDELVALPGLAPVPWSGPPPAVAVNLHGRGPQSHAALERLQPVETLSFRRPARAGEAASRGPDWDAGEHEVTRWCRMLHWYGLEPDPGELDLDPGSPIIGVEGLTGTLTEATVIHPGAASSSRRWPPDRFARVAASELAEGRMVIVTGSAAEVRLAHRVARLARLPPSAVLAGATDLGALARLVASVGLVVSGDTGMAHLATAVGTPSVVLFGPTSPARWGPPCERTRHIALWAGTEGDPHGETMDPGLLMISADDAIRAARSVRCGASIARLGEPRACTDRGVIGKLAALARLESLAEARGRAVGVVRTPVRVGPTTGTDRGDGGGQTLATVCPIRADDD